MKRKIYEWWINFLERFAKAEVERLRKDMNSVAMLWITYKQLYNLLVLEFLQTHPDLTMRFYERGDILSVTCTDKKGYKLQLPITQYQGLVKHVFGNVARATNVDDILSKPLPIQAEALQTYVLNKIVEKYDERK